MYIIKNTVEEKIIGKFETDAEFVHFMRTVAVENEDEDMSITCLSEAMDYLNNYCSNLELAGEMDYTVSLIITDISEISPIDAVKEFTKWVKDGIGDMIFEVSNQKTKKKFTVDMGEFDTDRVLPNDNNQDLIDKVLDRIKKDIKSGDLTSVNELLKSVDGDELVSFLSE